MITCSRCGSPNPDDRATCGTCGAAVRPPSRTSLPPPIVDESQPFVPLGRATAATSATPAMTSRVESFDDDLVPFLGDPDGSRVMGRAVQVTAVILVLYNLVRAALFGFYAAGGTEALRGGPGTPSYDRLIALGDVIDAAALFFWPSLVALLVVDIIWRNRRRPKDVLNARGEAYVEATITRVTPAWFRGLSVVIICGAVLMNFSSTPPRLTTQVTGYAAGRAFAAVLWALVFGGVIVVVIFSERHLARRVEKAANPYLAAYSVPYVEPERESGTVGTPAGPGWLLRTAGLIIAGLFALLVVIGSFFALATPKDRVGGIIGLLIAGPILGLVVWAFVRRFQRARA